jgi:transposase InsO family protein
VNLGLNTAIKALGYSRQSYYKAVRLIEKQKTEEMVIKERVLMIRRDQPKVGCRKLLDHLKSDFAISIGRDRFIEFMRSSGLLVKRKRNYKRTTNSQHRFKKYKNIVRDAVLARPNQAWASDITYLRLRKGFCYLSLITDMYSRKIVGFHVHHSLCIDGTLKALQRALQQRTKESPLIHHSDRGLQYCAMDYISLLKENNVQISMTEDCHVYENALAERVNGILKSEFYLDETLQDIQTARRMVNQVIDVYNNKRLHNSLGNKTPEFVHNLN